MLQYLTSLRPGEVTQMLLPTLLHAAVLRVAGVESLADIIPRAK